MGKVLKSHFFFIFLIFIVIISLLLIPYINKARTLMSLKTITPGSLYIITYYGDYKFSEYLQKGNENYQELFKFINDSLLHSSDFQPSYDTNWACSAFSSYNLKDEPIYARNLDIPGYHPAVILHTKPPTGYSSISMVELTTLGFNNNPEDLNHKLSTYSGRKALLASPYMPRDGMNEHGLVVATLNAPRQTIEKDPNKVSLGRWQVSRLLLDKAKTVDEAVTLLKNYNIFDGEVHFFIADSTGKSVVLEYSDAGMEEIYKNNSWQIVSNFLVSHPIEPGGGHDRYITANNLLKNYNGKITEDDAMRILKYLAQPSTAWSIVYNQNQKTINVVMDNKFSDIKRFQFFK